jgi:hypothetical protein
MLEEMMFTDSTKMSRHKKCYIPYVKIVHCVVGKSVSTNQGANLCKS